MKRLLSDCRLIQLQRPKNRNIDKNTKISPTPATMMLTLFFLRLLLSGALNLSYASALEEGINLRGRNSNFQDDSNARTELMSMEDAEFWYRNLQITSMSSFSEVPSSFPSPVLSTGAPSMVTEQPVTTGQPTSTQVISSSPTVMLSTQPTTNTDSPSHEPTKTTAEPSQTPSRQEPQVSSSPTQAPTDVPITTTSLPSSSPTQQPSISPTPPLGAAFEQVFGFSNPEDPRLLLGVSEELEITYFGDKDADGTPNALNSIAIFDKNLETDQIPVRINLDHNTTQMNGNRSSIILRDIYGPNGTYFRFNTSMYPLVQVYFRSEEEEFTTIVDLSENITESNTVSSSEEAKTRLYHPKDSYDDAGRVLVSRQYGQGHRQLNLRRQYNVNVKTCAGTPVVGAEVFADVILLGTDDIRLVHTTPFDVTSDANGNYAVNVFVDLEPSVSEVLEATCEITAGVVGDLCNIGTVLGNLPFAKRLICAGITAVGTPAAGVACAAAFEYLDASCHFLSPNVIPADGGRVPALGPLLCRNGAPTCSVIQDYLCDRIESEPSFTPDVYVRVLMSVITRDENFLVDKFEPEAFRGFFVETGPGIFEKRCDDGTCVPANHRQCDDGTCVAFDKCCLDKERQCLGDDGTNPLFETCIDGDKCCDYEKKCRGECVFQSIECITEAPTTTPECSDSKTEFVLGFDEFACSGNTCPILGDSVLDYGMVTWSGGLSVLPRPSLSLSEPNLAQLDENQGQREFTLSIPTSDGATFAMLGGSFRGISCGGRPLRMRAQGFFFDNLVAEYTFDIDHVTFSFDGSNWRDYTDVSFPPEDFSELTSITFRMMTCIGALPDPNPAFDVQRAQIDDLRVCLESAPTASPSSPLETPAPSSMATIKPTTKAPSPFVLEVSSEPTSK